MIQNNFSILDADDDEGFCNINVIFYLNKLNKYMWILFDSEGKLMIFENGIEIEYK